MKRLRKSNRVSWAPGVNLCQIKMFVSEDCPSTVGLKSQGKLPEKRKNYPQGFEVNHLSRPLKKEKVNHFPFIRWKCPPKFVMSHNWRVATGEESYEKEHQRLRQMRVLEAVYPRLSAIPPCPLDLYDAEQHIDDYLTPLVPLTPIEEEEESGDSPSGNIPVSSQTEEASSPRRQNNSNCQTPTVEVPVMQKNLAKMKLPDAGADISAAASAALTIMMKSNEQGCLIDTNLLIKILSDPKAIQKLLDDHKAKANSRISPANDEFLPVLNPNIPSNENQCYVPVPVQAVPVSGVQTASRKDITPLSGIKQSFGPSVVIPIPGMKQPSPIAVSSYMSGNGNFYYSAPNQIQPMSTATPFIANVGPTFSPMVKEAQSVKDVNYYKNLIRQHGEQEKTIEIPVQGQNGNLLSHFEHMKMVQSIKPGNLKNENKKTCMYFNTPNGCRKGISCPFKHDVSLQWRNDNSRTYDYDHKFQTAKRMKLSGEIYGRT